MLIKVKRFLPYFSYFLFWILVFIIYRATFLLYHFHLTRELDLSVIALTFLYGMRMDASFSAYICIFPFILLGIKMLSPRFRVRRIVRVYSIILILILSFISVADLELYTAWGYRMDATPLQYFKSPREMIATVSSAPVLILLVIFLLLNVILIYLLQFFNRRMIVTNSRNKILYGIVGIFMIALLFIPIRGGIQKIPLNISDVYFTDEIYADHAAINLPWNVMFSILNRNNGDNPFRVLDDNTAKDLVQELYKNKSNNISILTNDRPNLIFIILESFTAKLVGCLGGKRGVTPQLDAIAAEGLLFRNFYASGDRSEKGQVAILSGYPNQAINSIIKTPTKTMKLPGLAQTLESYGYTCSYTYGGELEFANIKSYLINTGYKNLVSKYSFPVSERTTSWGVHDQFTFNRFYDDLNKESQPFFSTIFSLSSHEPFDVPLHHFNGKGETDLFENSVYYADSVLGDFIRKIKKEPYWKNTLVVIVADHGHPLPGHDENDVPSKFHIPLVFTGGALTEKGIVDTYGSQTDIATTILDQMKIPADQFKWGRDLLDSAGSFAFYNFNNGFGWVTGSGYATVDNVSGRIIHQSPSFDTSQLKFARAYMQVSYQDYLNR